MNSYPQQDRALMRSLVLMYLPNSTRFGN